MRSLFYLCHFTLYDVKFPGECFETLDLLLLEDAVTVTVGCLMIGNQVVHHRLYLFVCVIIFI